MNENTISYKLERINNAVDRIRVKTQTTNQPIEDVASAVEGIESVRDYFDLTSSTTQTTHVSPEMGGWYKAIIGFPKITNKLSSYEKYFKECPFENLNVSGLDTSIATSFHSMFLNSYHLKVIDGINNLDTSNVTTMRETFTNCSELQSLDLSRWNTSKVTEMRGMFSGCYLLIFLDIRNFNFSNVTSSDYMFDNVPSNCLIIVKDETAKSWVLSKKSSFTNVKTVAEYEGA